MKTITKTIATIAITLTLFAFPVIADCGEQTSGNRCLVGNPNPTTTSQTTKVSPFDLDKHIPLFLKDFIVKIFG